MTPRVDSNANPVLNQQFANVNNAQNTNNTQNTGNVNNNLVQFLYGQDARLAGTNDLFNVDNNAVSSTFLNDVLYKLEGLSKSTADIFTVMAMMVKMSKELREGARQVRSAQNNAQQAELQNAADKMRQAADKAFAAAAVSGAFKIVAGAGSIGGGIYGIKQMKGAQSKAEGAYAKGDVDSPAVSQETIDLIKNRGRVVDGATGVLGGMGDIIAAQFTKESTYLGADQKEAEAAAQAHETYAQREADFMNSLQETIRQVISLIQEILQSTQESEKRAAGV